MLIILENKYLIDVSKKQEPQNVSFRAWRFVKMVKKGLIVEFSPSNLKL